MNAYLLKHVAMIAFSLAILTAGGAPTLAQRAPDAVYLNGTVITLDNQSRVAEAIAVRGGTILAVGTTGDVRALASGTTVVHDLTGATIIPGFYAAHDHFPQSGVVALFKVDLNSPPIGAIHDMSELITALKAAAEKTPKGKWVTGRGYDDTLLKEGRHPTRYDLDKVSTEHPILITHISGHLCVANSKALELAKVTRNTPQPAGGRIRKDDAGEPDGVFEEATGIVGRLVPGVSRDDMLHATEHAVREYTSRGVTTAVLAGGSMESLANLRRSLAAGLLKIRVVTMTSGNPLEEPRKAIQELNSDRLKVGAIKFWQDGSIQGFTGYLSKPYHTPFQGDASYRGYAARSREALVTRVKELHKSGYQIAIHANGDSAIDDVLFAYVEAQKETPRPDTRHRIEHCQTAREDQLDEMKRLGLTPSFFAGHVYYWGDRHAGIFLGPERAARISPLASALKRGIRFTMHDDTPVTPVNPIQDLWVATNRQTTGGKVLGAEQRITAEQALRAVTADAAWQNFEEKIKGTLEVGKLADFVVIDGNPLTLEPGKLRELQVLETVVGGETVYRR